jgi:cytochrome c oxidase assembly protein subunit 15
MNAEPEPNRGARGGDLLTIAFATTVAMWALLYVAAMPPGHTWLWIVVAVAIVGGLFGAGFVTGRFAGRGLAGGAGLGLILAAISLLVLLSLAGGGEPGEVLAAVWWILGFLAAAVVLCGLGAALGARAARALNWTTRLAWVTAITVLLMLIAGGIVTGLEAGLAVEGWLIAEGHLLVLFPKTLMQRDMGTFAEHAHRLWGLLVGLTTIVLLVHVWMVDRRTWLRWLAMVLVAAVVGQGILGGTRVTEQSVLLGIVHGIVAPCIFAIAVALAAATSTTWLSDRQPLAQRSVHTDRTLTLLLLVALGIQITLGTVFRHVQPQAHLPRPVLIATLHSHSFIGATFAAVMALFCGLRAWGMYREVGPVKIAGAVLLYAVMIQLGLGVASFVVVPKQPGADAAYPMVEVVITSIHQVVGAIVVATAVAVFAWERRLLAVSPETQAETT